MSFTNSRTLLQRLRQVDALAQARPGMFLTGYTRLGGYPAFVERAAGPYIWDVDGNRYLDYMLGYGSVILGHADPTVTAAVNRTLSRGVNPSLLSPVHVELAERIVEISPCAELVTFLKTGSDAIAAAVRLARAVTGRTHILQWGHHGWHDWFATLSPGVLPDTKARVHPFQYNNIEDTARLLDQFRGDVAAVVMMPYEIEAPRPGYLQELKQLAHEHGALFIFDEVRSGFRIALGGAQQRFNVVPDLAAFSKAIANGHAISVLAGRREYMQHILDLALTVTYYRLPEAMAAALATINEIETIGVADRLTFLGSRLIAGLQAAALQAGIPARAVGFPATPFIEFDYDDQPSREHAMRQFCNGMLGRGVLMMPAHHWFLCASMSTADIDQTIEAATAVFSEMARTS
ncbi:glutamate-1-semialdehyde 2,1-aminomutase [Mycobacteroides abscessus subsp. abscessus]|uniref:aminotransferase class III-fold pyridoxal phosphate-dependent enzyme n=1 Tax=Mycobacteroides abscessus TaxID=36809 RepID=UPI0009287700|nr:aminotransferase class III-fold pyridoxal phosphate-dependent enzyme [Mycobacteroides abscessus]SHR30132.1 glutamate-1-semialdehyde 2,1-aminomutase [Mycobacteroides abscessus subsp. abscessus]